MFRSFLVLTCVLFLSLLFTGAAKAEVRYKDPGPWDGGGGGGSCYSDCTRCGFDCNFDTGVCQEKCFYHITTGGGCGCDWAWVDGIQVCLPVGTCEYDPGQNP